MSEKINPCPFCGNETTIEAIRVGDTRWAQAVCNKCLACGPEVRAPYGDDFRERAIEGWNDRQELWQVKAWEMLKNELQKDETHNNDRDIMTVCDGFLAIIRNIEHRVKETR